MQEVRVKDGNTYLSLNIKCGWIHEDVLPYLNLSPRKCYIQAENVTAQNTIGGVCTQPELSGAFCGQFFICS